jgi:hypothetical protein
MSSSTQILRRLAALETRMAPPEPMKFDWVILFVESQDAKPTGRCTRVRYRGDQKISEEDIVVPVEQLTANGKKQRE